MFNQMTKKQYFDYMMQKWFFGERAAKRFMREKYGFKRIVVVADSRQQYERYCINNMLDAWDPDEVIYVAVQAPRFLRGLDLTRDEIRVIATENDLTEALEEIKVLRSRHRGKPTNITRIEEPDTDAQGEDVS